MTGKGAGNDDDREDRNDEKREKALEWIGMNDRRRTNESVDQIDDTY